MIKTDIKDALINYHMIKKGIKIDQDNLTVIRNMKVKIGGSFAKIPQNPVSREKMIISNMDKEDFYLLELTNHEYKLFIVNKFIDECSVFPVDVKQFVIDIYIKKINSKDVELKHDLSKQYMYKAIDDEIDQFVKRMNQ